MKNTNVTKNIETYTCPICGAETPARFTVDTSYGHVCYSCAMKLHNAHEYGKFGKYGRLLGTTAWNSLTITRDMAKEAYELMNEKFDAGETIDLHHHFYDCVMAGVFFVEADNIVNGTEWKDTYVENATTAYKDKGNDTFTKEEVMICLGSIFQNNVKHVSLAKWAVEAGLMN